jgi:hypothetical protein
LVVSKWLKGLPYFAEDTWSQSEGIPKIRSSRSQTKLQTFKIQIFKLCKDLRGGGYRNFSVHQITMASQKMALLAVAAGLLCMSALLNGAEASVSASHQQQSEIDTCVHSY